MIRNEIGFELHHRSVLGETLSAEENASLQVWYEQMDREEAGSLRHLNLTNERLAVEIVALEKRVAEKEKHNQEMAARNAVLLAEIEVMKKELKQRRPDIYAELARAAEAV